MKKINSLIKVIKNYFYSLVSGKFNQTQSVGNQVVEDKSLFGLVREKKQPNRWWKKIIDEIKERKEEKIMGKKLDEEFLNSWVFKNDHERKEWLKSGKNGALTFQKKISNKMEYYFNTTVDVKEKRKTK